jgi:DNA modification methylase
MKNNHRKFSQLYANPLPSTRTGALYNAFPYPTKISAETIALFIACHTNVGDTILDTFAGSGTTGVATLLCDSPTDTMIGLARELDLNPKWGPRKAVLYELSVLGAFVSKVLCSKQKSSRFNNAASDLIQTVENENSNLYASLDPKGRKGTIRHVIWSDVLLCPSCNTELSFWEIGVQKEPTTKLLEEVDCPSCNCAIKPAEAKKVTQFITDPISNKSVEKKMRVPVRIYGKTNRENWCKPPSQEDLRLISEIESMPITDFVPNAKIIKGDLYRSGYHFGIDHIYDLYTKRNLLVMSKLWARIKHYPKDIQDALKFLILSYNSSNATLMSRVVIKNGKKDFILTGAQSGVLYISSLPVEKNIFDGLRRKQKTISQAFDLLSNSKSSVDVYNRSSTKLKLEDESVDYVFTDPPFGDYIPYAELNQINEAWLENMTKQKDEIIISTAQKKGVNEYAQLIAKVFTEIERVLKTDGSATVVFHSAKANVWEALKLSIDKANLKVQITSILDKVQTSFKQSSTNIHVKGDPLILLTKQRKSIKTRKINSDEVILDILNRVENSNTPDSEKTLQRLYSRYVSKCLELDLPVLMGAHDFYKQVNNRLEQNNNGAGY